MCEKTQYKLFVDEALKVATDPNMSDALARHRMKIILENAGHREEETHVRA